MVQSFVLVPASDLRLLELTCPFCQRAKVVIDVQDMGNTAFPESCPGCKKEWNGFTNPSFTKTMRGLTDFLSTLSGTKMNPQFRIEEDSKE